MTWYCRANLEGMDDQCDPNPFDKYVTVYLIVAVLVEAMTVVVCVGIRPRYCSRC